MFTVFKRQQNNKINLNDSNGCNIHKRIIISGGFQQHLPNFFCFKSKYFETVFIRQQNNKINLKDSNEININDKIKI